MTSDSALSPSRIYPVPSESIRSFLTGTHIFLSFFSGLMTSWMKLIWAFAEPSKVGDDVIRAEC